MELRKRPINYWKDIKKEINQTVDEMYGLVLLTHNSAEFNDLIDFIERINKNQKCKVLYISLTRSFEQIKENIAKKTLENKELYVVDCVSGFLIEIQESVNCIFRRPPKNFEEMKNLLTKNIDRVKPEIVIIDSITQYINFSKPTEEEINELYHFLKSIKKETMTRSVETVIMMYDDKMQTLKKLPHLYTDLILRMEIIKN